MAFAQMYRTSMHKMNGDLLTPVLLFSRLQGKQKFLLESSNKYEHLGRYSFIGTTPRKTYKGQGNLLTEISHATKTTYHYEGELVSLLKQVMPRIINRTDYPFTGGAVGTIQHIDNELQAEFQVYDTLIIFDHLTEELIILHTNIEAEQMSISFDHLLMQLCEGEAKQYTPYEVSNTKVKGDLFSLYRDLRVAAPSPYLFYIEQAERTVIGSADESFIRVHEQVVTSTAHHALQPFAKLQDGEQSGVLHPTVHAIDALGAVAPHLPTTGAAGYIGFNGQIDFAPCTQCIVIENGQIVSDDSSLLARVKG